MTPREKAIDLRFAFWKNADLTPNQARQCALITIDEIEKALTDYGSGDSNQLQNMDSEFRCWDAVKQEIEKL